MIPPFDLATYARESMPPSVQHPPRAPGAAAGSEAAQHGGGGTPTHPAKAPESGDEVPTMIPAKPFDELVEDAPTVIPPRAPEMFRSQMPTFTDENELEQARARSAVSFSSAPPERNSTVPVPESGVSGPPGSLSGRISALSLADMRMPTPPPMNAVNLEDPEIEFASSSSDKSKKGVQESSDPPPPSQVDPLVDMRDRFSLGDYSGALAVAEMILVKEPSNVEAAKMAEECQRVLIKMYAARIGPLDRVPMVMVQPHELRWLSIDHRAGFLLSLVDGMSSIEMILDVSGMPLLDTLRILHELYQQRVISFRT